MLGEEGMNKPQRIKLLLILITLKRIFKEFPIKSFIWNFCGNKLFCVRDYSGSLLLNDTFQIVYFLVENYLKHSPAFFTRTLNNCSDFCADHPTHHSTL